MTQSIDNLLGSIQHCDACGLMKANNALGITLVPIKPKPLAKVVFIGRDPSPRTAEIVGERGGRSVFINTIFNIVDTAKVSEDLIYITDVCKCHWRTSVGQPIKGTESRDTQLDETIARCCMNKWLTREISILQPKLLIAFGEELYHILLDSITYPGSNKPKKLSASMNKSTEDAEKWFVENGPMTISLDQSEYQLAVLRHPGNTQKLRRDVVGDLRYQYYRKSFDRTVEIVRLACGLTSRSS